MNWFVPICNENVSEYKHKHSHFCINKEERERERARPEQIQITRKSQDDGVLKKWRRWKWQRKANRNAIWRHGKGTKRPLERRWRWKWCCWLPLFVWTNRQQHRNTIYRVLHHYDDFSFSFQFFRHLLLLSYILDVANSLFRCCIFCYATKAYPNNVNEFEWNCRFPWRVLKCYYYDRLAGSVTISIRPTKRFRRFSFVDYYLWWSCLSHLCVPHIICISNNKKYQQVFEMFWNEHSKQTFIDDDICFCFYYKFSWAFNFTHFHVCAANTPSKAYRRRVPTVEPISTRCCVCLLLQRPISYKVHLNKTIGCACKANVGIIVYLKH